MSIKQKSLWYGIRIIRKVTHLGNRALHKALSLSTRVENKATRILDGTDYSVKLTSSDPLEKVYYDTIPFVLPINPALPRVGQKASVVLLIPSLDGKSFYGGAATALVVAAKIALHMKRPLRIVQTTKTGVPAGLQQFFDREGVRINSEEDITILSVAERAYNVYGYLAMHPDDVFIASAWWDAHALHSLPMKRRFIYLIQDFEPIFYNNSDQYVLAEETYMKPGFVPVCNTKLMLEFMLQRGYPRFKEQDSFFFEPAVSRSKQAAGSKPKKPNEKKVLFLYGRPNVHRNLFFTALNSLEHAFNAGFLDPKEWDLCMAGDDKLPDIKLASGPTIRNKGKLSMEDYIAFSATVDIAVSPMMAPHPNYPTLEFSSTGAQVVTTRYANKVDLSGYSPNIIMCDTNVESMAQAINEAAQRVSTKNRKRPTTNNTQLPQTWDDSLDTIIEQVIAAI